MTSERNSDRAVLLKGGGVITMDTQLGDMPVGDVLIRNGRIEAVQRNLMAADAEVIDASQMIVMPGFIDGHRHLWESVLRNTLPTEDLNGYFQMINGAFGPVYTPEDAYIGILAGALGALDAGITTVFDWSHIQTTPDHTRAAINALRTSGIRAVFGFGPSGGQDRNGHWPNGLRALQKEEFQSTDQLLTLALAGTSPEHVPDEVAKAQFYLARDAGVIMSVHAGIAGLGELHQIERFAREGLLSPRVNLVHCNTFTSREWQAVADCGAGICITPTVEMQMGHGIPPIQPALDVGIKPSLGIDVETSAPLDMWTQMRSIFSLQRMQAFEKRFAGGEAPAMLDCHDVLECATIGGARSMCLDHVTGTLTPGKAADVILLRTDMLNVMPVNDMKTAVLLGMDPRNVDTVFVNGVAVKRGGKMVGVDLTKLRQELYASRERVFAASQAAWRTPMYREALPGARPN
jgi:cytosine/adenosine deaminase-related metal-dependent hydrolase